MNEKYESPEPDQNLWYFWRKRRYILTLMLFLGFCNVYSLRVNLSVAIVALTNGKNETLPNGEVIYHPPPVDYSKQQQGVILSSFFYGYILTQVFGGLIARKVSAHIVYGIGIFATSILTVFTPLVAKNFYALVSIRIIEGLFEGVTFPCLHAMLSKWAPPLERTRMNSIAFAGNYIGTVIAMPLSGIFGDVWGWESIFYIFGTVGCIWYVAWLMFIRGSPDTDPWITEEERSYIKKSLAGATNEKPPKTPWKAIFLSTAVWAIIFAHFSENWGYYTLLTQLPTFLNDVIHFDLKKAGFTSSLPYLTMGVLMGFTGYAADFLITKRILTTTQVRKYFNCGGFIAQCTFMMMAAYVLNPTFVIVCLTLGVGLGAFSLSGFAVNHLDIAPQHAAVLMGITNTFATVPGIVSPLLTGLVVTSEDENIMKNQWRIVFFVSASIYLIGCVVYWIFASGELQSWATEPRESVNLQKTINGDNVPTTKTGYVNKAMSDKE